MHEGPGIDRAFVRFGVESLQDQLSALIREIDGVLTSDDPEYIHRMRVASRRIRTRLALFASCLPDHKATQWSRHFKGITGALGNARDTDVQIIYVNETLQGIQGREKDGVKRLLLRLTQRRRRLQKQVARAISRLQDDGAIREMEDTLRTMRGAFLLRKTADYSEATYRSVRDEISSRIAEMLGYAVYIHEPARIDELHAMRIAAKHLRYCMESFEPLYDRKLKKHIKAVKTIQEQLGDIHDCDVWMELLPAFLVEEKERIAEFTGQTRSVGRLKPGIALLEADRRAFRQKRYKEFIAFWEANSGLWPELLDTLSSFFSPGEDLQDGQGNPTP